MKTFNTLTLLVFISLLITSCKDDEPSGPAGALGKSFNLVFDKASTSIAYNIVVSPDGTKMILVMQDNNTEVYYSTDAGTTFNKVWGNTIAPNVVDIDNQGNVRTTDNTVVNPTDNSIGVYPQGGDVLILGDKGKVFAYNVNSNTIKQKNITSNDFTVVNRPSDPAPGGGSYVLRAPGKGLLYFETSPGTSRTVKAYLLDETTLQWSSAITVSFDLSNLNTNCGLNSFEKYIYGGNNVMVAKGCSGAALLDLNSKTTTYITYPASEHLIYEDVRDGQFFVDANKQAYLIARTSDDLSKRHAYKLEGSTVSRLDGFLELNNVPVFAHDEVGNIYFNSIDPFGKSLKGAIKFNLATGTSTGLNALATPIAIDDAIEVDGNKLLMVIDDYLYTYDISATTTTRVGITNISHINVLSDGRWLAGGRDHLYLSSNEGGSWTETDKIFSSLDPNMGAANVVASRIVNNQLQIDGSYHYLYYNYTLGIQQDKYTNMMIALNGSASSELQYQFPNDLFDVVIGPDGSLYGYSEYIDGFSNTVDRYEVKPGAAPERQETPGLKPMIITDSGLQMSIGRVKNGTGAEIVTRNSDTETFTSSNTPLPGNGTGVIRLSGSKLVYIDDSSIYISGN